MQRIVMPIAGLLISRFAVGATPDYTGTLCPTEDGCRVEVHTEPETTLMIIYPTPPGTGGWMMSNESPGVFWHDIPGVVPGDAVSFSLLLQNPQQYVYPAHELALGAQCAAFERDDVMPPPTRGFRHDLDPRDGIPTLRFQSGAPGLGIPETTQVSVTYRLDGGAFVTAPLDQVGSGVWEVQLPDAVSGQSIEYWLSQVMGIQTVHTALHDRVIGDPEAEPNWPIVTRQSGRFRHRHPNEWRFDNYVEDYGAGRTFQIEVTDWGTRVDVVVTVDPGLEVGQVDFKYFVENDPYSDTCNRPLTVMNTVMSKSSNVFTGSIEDTTPGAILDFDFAFVDLPAGNPVAIYYSDFYYYRVAKGHFGPETPNPRAVPAGPATSPNVFSLQFGFAQHAPTLAHDDLKRFLDGKLLFETDYETGELLNLSTHFDCCAGPIGQPLEESPVFQPSSLGPVFNAASCMSCHAMDGRGATPAGGDILHQVVTQVSDGGVTAHGGPTPHPTYGHQLNSQSIGDEPPEGVTSVSYEIVEGTFDDGTTYTLRSPVYSISDAHNILDDTVETSHRIAPMLAGLGMLEAVDEAAIRALADPTDLDGDGISGRVNDVWDEASQTVRLGRFGWKANQPNLRQQAAAAFVLDMGLTSPLYPVHDCGDASAQCDPEEVPDLTDADLDDVEAYLRGLTLPPRRNFEDPDAMAGMHLFRQANCHACHTPRLQTSANADLSAYRGITIEPFTDLLLHDMGPGLADDRPHFAASGSEWRTPPLWGLSYVEHALGVPETCEDPTSGGTTPNFLHDGRATTIMEAILWHGGEAEASRNAVLAMTASERNQLVAYTAYPFADPSFDAPSGDCPADLNGDGLVDLNDLLAMLGAWNQPGAADLDGDGLVDADDLTLIIHAWGPC